MSLSSFTVPKTSKPRLPTTAEHLAELQERTNTHIFPDLQPRADTEPTTSELVSFLQDWKSTSDRLAIPFTPYNTTLSALTPPYPTSWLWHKRIPSSGLTLLGGDHNTCKTLFAHQLATSVSTGVRLLGNIPIQEGGCVIVSPTTNVNAQLRLLTSLGANLARIKILSFIQEIAPAQNTSGYVPFSLPEDFPSLFEAIDQVQARLVIFDPFMQVLSRAARWTNERLGSLLADLNQRLLERNVAGLLIRNYGVRGSHARPSILEKSDHFSTFASSHLLLAPHPLYPDRLLLSQAQNRQDDLAPTLILKIERTPTKPAKTAENTNPEHNQNPQLDTPPTLPQYPGMPHITVLGKHHLQGQDFLDHRPDTLHRRLLTDHISRIIAERPGNLPISTLYEQCPNSSPFQVHRVLTDLVNIGKIIRHARGSYASISSKAPPSKTATTTPSDQNTTNPLKNVATKTSNPNAPNPLKNVAAKDTAPTPTQELNRTAAKDTAPTPIQELNRTAAKDTAPTPTQELNRAAAKERDPPPSKEPNLNSLAATTPNIPPASALRRCPNQRHAPGCQCNL